MNGRKAGAPNYLKRVKSEKGAALDKTSQERYKYTMRKKKVGTTNYIQKTPPKCRACRHPSDNDPKRMMVFTKDANNDNRDVVVIKCPSLRCGNGWFAEAIWEKVDFCKT